VALITDFQLRERLTVNITPAMRRFSAENFGNPQHLEDWLAGVDCHDPEMQPFTAEFWWKQLIRSLPYVAAEDEGEPW
jgi:hypothetical protein